MKEEEAWKESSQRRALEHTSPGAMTKGAMGGLPVGSGVAPWRSWSVLRHGCMSAVVGSYDEDVPSRRTCTREYMYNMACGAPLALNCV